MKLFRTPIQADVSSHAMGIFSRVVTVGSCFSDTIGRRLGTYKVQALANPFGTVYNPHTVHTLLMSALQGTPPADDGYVHHHDAFLHHDFHSEFASMHQEELTTQLLSALHQTQAFLRQSDTLILTYGTAWVYTQLHTGKIVANCHKVPARQFTKSLLSAADIEASFASLYAQLKAVNPALRIILTVSPVRHIKDTLPLNSVSKSVLRVVCHTLSQSYKNVDYFPSYEIMVDDLRDYRFYKSDMIHPSEEAEDYIWENFVARYFNQEARDFFTQWDRVLAAMHHRPFLPASAAHQQFLTNTLKKLEELNSFVDVTAEITWFRTQLIRYP